jgi:hypothetical protein
MKARRRRRAVLWWRRHPTTESEMKKVWLVMVALSVVLAGCAGLHPDHEDCVGPPSFCNIYSN